MGQNVSNDWLGVHATGAAVDDSIRYHFGNLGIDVTHILTPTEMTAIVATVVAGNQVAFDAALASAVPWWPLVPAADKTRYYNAAKRLRQTWC